MMLKMQLADMLKTELKDTKSIIYIPAGEERVEKVANKFIPSFERNGIHFENTISKETDEKKQLEERKERIINPSMTTEQAISLLENAV